MRKIYKKLLMLLVVIAMLSGNIMSASAITSETLDEVKGKHAVSGNDATGSFKVKLRENDDAITIYKIADIKWESDTYKAAEWVDAVKTWLTANNKTQYDTPAKLSAATSSIQTDTLNELLGFKDSVTGVDVSNLTKVDTSKLTKTEAKDKIVVTEDNKDKYPNNNLGDVVQEAAEGYYTVSGVSFGIYAVLGTKSGSTKYAPLTVAVAPEHDGAAGHWYIDEDIEAALKASDVTMEKKINGKDADIVHIGETVDFQINYTLPTYGNRDTTTGAQYTLAFDDELNKAFSLKADTVKVKYKTSSDTSWSDAAEFPTDYYSAIIAGPYSSDTESGLTVWGCSPAHLAQYTIYENTVKQSDGTTMYYYYYYRDGAYHLLKNNSVRTMPQMTGSQNTVTVQKTPSTTRLATADNKNGYQIRALYSEATGDTVNHGWQEFTVDQYPEYGKNIFNISFDYGKIKNDSKFKDKDIQMQITYKAVVNSNAEVGAETNTNTATMKYETNSAGTTFGTISDTVTAYTYSVNVVKQDGDTKDYLAGAKFNLYRETDTFCEDKWLSNYDKDNTNESTSLADYKAANATDYYYTVKVNTGDKGSPTCSDKEGEHTHTRVFKKYKMSVSGTEYFNGEITSVAKKDGVTVKGLDVGNYVLEETQAPSAAYKELAEDILFTIDGLDDSVAATQYSGSYKAFKDSDAKVHEDGNYSLNILNYKGISLPSTGGIGTMLFTVIGILIMLIVMIMLLAKNRRNRNILSSVIAVILTTAMIAGNASFASATSSVVLNNNYGAQVTGDGTTNFGIEVKNKDDKVDVYKIAELKWDEAENTYKGIEWVYDVRQWVGSNTTYSAYDTPEKLGAADVSTQTKFFEALYKERKANNIEQNDKVASGKITKDSDDSTKYTVKDAEYGIYLVVANNEIQGKNYQPVSVNVMPTQEGPLGNWFLKSDISTNLKYETLKVDKKVNGKDYDTVKAGEEVSFMIDGEVPDYPKKDSSDKTKYPLSIDDIMSATLSYVADSYKVQYKAGDDWKNLDSDVYTAVFADKAASAAASSRGAATYANGANVIYAYCYDSNGKTYTDYYVLTDEKQLTKLNSDSIETTLAAASVSSANILSKYKEVTGKTVTSFSRQSDSNWTSLYNVTFDYDKLKELKAEKVRITYKAKVTKDVAIGTDDNSNKAQLYYQKDASGDVTYTDDIVYVWSYGLKVVKLDGESQTKSYLANAKFHLYEEQYEYVPNAQGLGITSDDYSNYVFSERVDGDKITPTGFTKTDKSKVDLSTLDKVADVVSSYTNDSGNEEKVTDVGDIASADSYYRRKKIAASTTCTCAANGSEHYHIVVCKLIKDDITSVNTADGVKVTGLEPGTYVLKEVQAPAGYNKLNEALIFEIKDIGDTKADNTYNGSHKAFVSDDGTYYDDGIYPVDVTNYKGVSLPATGGIGTTIFIIIGICIMLAAMLTLLLHMRKRDADGFDD